MAGSMAADVIYAARQTTLLARKLDSFCRPSVHSNVFLWP